MECPKCMNDDVQNDMNLVCPKCDGQVMKWIKVEDKFPEFNQQVLCFDPNHSEAKIYVVKLEKENFYEVDKCKLGHPQQWIEAAGESYFTWNPTHWAPLPKAPE